MNIKSLFSEKFKTHILYYLSSSDEWKDILRFKDKKKIIVALAGDYGNFGDIAITIAQNDWLKEKFPDYEIINFPISKTYNWTKTLKKVMGKDDIITLIGGGNTGDLYWSIELCRQFIIKKFPYNKIVAFPQTIFHEDEKKMKVCINAYSKHKNLTFAIREKDSLGYAEENFRNNKIIFTPDTALLLKVPPCQKERKGISVIFREDKEGFLTKEDNENIYNSLKKSYDIDVFDTVFRKETSLSLEDSREKFYAFLERIQKSQVVITNRLHAMVFCAVTGTPCLVLPVIGIKVKGVYDVWLKDLNYIKYLDSYDTEEIIQATEKMKNIVPNRLDLSEEFAPLYEALSK